MHAFEIDTALPCCLVQAPVSLFCRPQFAFNMHPQLIETVLSAWGAIFCCCCRQMQHAKYIQLESYCLAVLATDTWHTHPKIL